MQKLEYHFKILRMRVKSAIFALHLKYTMIPERIIDSIVERFEDNESGYEEAINELMDTQPALLAFLTQESSEVLIEEEKDIMWYIHLIIFHSCLEAGWSIPEIDDSTLSENEEANWEVYQQTTTGSFRERITPLFEDFSEEDLLAFVEDTLEIEEDSPITKVGREVIFMMAKTTIDALIHITTEDN